MPKLKRLNSGACSARKVIPKDVREEYCALFGGGWEERFYVNAGTSLGEAKRALNDWLGEIERRISVICSRDHENAERRDDAGNGILHRYSPGKPASRRHAERPLSVTVSRMSLTECLELEDGSAICTAQSAIQNPVY